MKSSVALFVLLSASCSAGSAFAPALTPGSFDGWHAAPGGHWRWRGDVLVGTSPATEPRHGILISDASYSDFEARLEFRVLSGDSGFYFRVKEEGGRVAVHGFQAEVDTTFETGGLYETGGRAWWSNPTPRGCAASTSQARGRRSGSALSERTSTCGSTIS